MVWNVSTESPSDLGVPERDFAASVRPKHVPMLKIIMFLHRPVDPL